MIYTDKWGIRKVKAQILLVLFFIMMFGIGVSQTPSWDWALSAGGTSYDYSNGVCNDIKGNTYSTGYFSQTITFGDITLTDVGGSDVFLVKFDPNGNVIWAKSYGGTSLDFANNMSINSNGEIVITGAFRSESITFGSTTLTNPNSGNGANALFVVKFDMDGNVLWAYTATGDGNCSGSDIDIDINGNVVVTGNFDGQSVTFGTTTLTNFYQFATDIFIAKFDSQGNVVWAASYGGNSYDIGTGITFDNSGYINLIGSFRSNEITFGVTTYNNTGGYDYFVVQFSSDGNIVWLRNAPGDGDDYPQDIDVDADNNIFITGDFSGSYISFSGIEITGNGSLNIFTIKYSSGGNPEWVESPQGDLNDESYALTIDVDGNCLITGTFESNTLDFGQSVSVTNNNGDYGDILVAKYSNDGIIIWAIEIGGNDLDYGQAISVNNIGNAFITGVFYSTTISFGNNTLVNSNSSNNSPDYFMSKLNSIVGLINNQSNYSNLVYPNPNNGGFNIKADRIQSIELYSWEGRKIPVSMNVKSKNNVDISFLPAGVYFIKVMDGKKVITEKVIKK